jgi:hypothetical protein
VALTLTVTFAVACFAIVMSMILLAVHPDPGVLGSAYGIQQNQRAKTGLYVVAFVIVLPLSLAAATRAADAIAAGPNAPALRGLVAWLAGTLAATLVLVRVSRHLPWGDGLGVLLGAVGTWAAAAAVGLLRVARGGAWPVLLRLPGSGSSAPLMAGLLVFATVLCVTSIDALSLTATAVGALVTVLAVACFDRGWRLPRVPARLGSGLDVIVIAILLVAVPDVVVFETTSAQLSVFAAPGIIQFHHDFLLGPTNQVLAGGALMVDAPVSQYGVGSIYFLAGWFHLAPIGYGTYGLLDGLLTALFYAAGYCLLRIAGVSRLLAACTLAVGVTALLYGLAYPVGSLPQQGPLRFGLPMAAILALVAGARWLRHERSGRLAAFAVLGVSSIWALEALAYTAVTVAAMLALQASLMSAGVRRRWLVRQIVLAGCVCVCAHLALAGATLAATGKLPDWGEYLAYLRAFLLGGKAGELNYGFEPWSPALALGAAYVASAAGIVLVLRRRPGAAGERVALIALAGLTAYGIALLSYTDNRSSTYLVPYVALPALVGGAVWLALLLRSPLDVPRRMRSASLAFALSVAVLLVASSWPVGHNFSRTALAHASPGGGLRAALHRVWHPPPIDRRAPAGERLLDRYMPGQRRVLVVLPSTPDLATEILMRSGRAELLRIGDPTEMSFLPSLWAPELGREVDGLRPGTRLLMNRDGRRLLAGLKAYPGLDLLRTAIGRDTLEEWVLQRLDRTFVLKPLHEDRNGFIVAEVASRR